VNDYLQPPKGHPRNGNRPVTDLAQRDTCPWPASEPHQRMRALKCSRFRLSKCLPAPALYRTEIRAGLYH